MATDKQLQNILTKHEYDRFHLFRKSPSRKDLKEMGRDRIKATLEALKLKKSEYQDKVKELKSTSDRTDYQSDLLQRYQDRKKTLTEIMAKAKDSLASLKEAKSPTQKSGPATRKTKSAVNSTRKNRSKKGTSEKAIKMQRTQSVSSIKPIDRSTRIPRTHNIPIPEEKRADFAADAQIDSQNIRRKNQSDRSEAARQSLHFASTALQRIEGHESVQTKKNQGRTDAR